MIKTKKSFFSIISVLLIFFSIALGYILYSSELTAKEKAYNNLKTIPIIHDGRIKPLDTFARITLKSLANKEAINGKSAIAWLVELLIDPKQDYESPIFYIHNPSLHNLLDLKTKTKPYYSFKEVLPGIKNNISLISNLERTSKNDQAFIEPAKKQLLDLYHKTLLYFDLSRSMSLLLPEFQLNHIENSLSITLRDKVTTSQNKINYYQLLPFKQKIAHKVDTLVSLQSNKRPLDVETIQFLALAKKFKDISQDRINIYLKILPNHSKLTEQGKSNTNNWLAPWEASINKLGNKEASQHLLHWQQLIYSYYNNDFSQFQSNSKSLYDYSISKVNDSSIQTRLSLEIIYNNTKLFNKSILFYSLTLFTILAFMFIPSYWPKTKTCLYRFSYISFIGASICHLCGLLCRIIILQRPPVANLYESILFVSLITAITSGIIEYTRKDSLGLFTGSLICTVLQFIANSYGVGGDTLGVLIAVLDNNFWLGTHVIVITSGYGSCLMLSALSHYYLLTHCLQHKYTDELSSLKKSILCLGLISLFLTLLGTILGGIWADQSWGRFWGWDPKENGALLICLWLTAILHGKVSGQLKELAYITGCALTSIMVMLAWFGVNVLGTGLHSYGFTDNIAKNLGLFILLELILILGLFVIANKTQKRML